MHKGEHILLTGKIDHPVPIDTTANQHSGAVYGDVFGASECYEQLSLRMRKRLVGHRKAVVRSAKSTAREECVKAHQKQFKSAAPPPLA